MEIKKIEAKIRWAKSLAELNEILADVIGLPSPLFSKLAKLAEARADDLYKAEYYNNKGV